MVGLKWFLTSMARKVVVRKRMFRVDWYFLDVGRRDRWYTFCSLPGGKYSIFMRLPNLLRTGICRMERALENTIPSMAISFEGPRKLLKDVGN